MQAIYGIITVRAHLYTTYTRRCASGFGSVRAQGGYPLDPPSCRSRKFYNDERCGKDLLMAIYHCSIKIGTRSKGQSAIAAAAYRSGTKIFEEETGLTSDYTKKKNIVFSEISLCDHAPKEYQDRATLWNAVHQAEKSKDGQLWREIEVALPIEFSREQQIEVVRKFVAQLTAQGMCADWSIHDPDEKNKNPHAHIMLTTRSILSDGKWAPKAKKIYDLDESGNKIPLIDKETGEQKVDKNKRKQWKNHKENYNDWNEKERVEEWRTAWEIVCNELLSEDKKIDHRSYERQGIEKVPTKHEGFVARQMATRGEEPNIIKYNQSVKRLNADADQTAKDIFRAEKEISERTQSLYEKIQAEKEKAVTPVPLEEHAQKILALRNRYFADSINLSVKNRTRLSTDYTKLALKSKAEQAEVAVKALPRFAEKVRSLAEKIKSLSIFKRKEKLQITDERAAAVDDLKKNMLPIVAIGVGKNYDCENPTESNTNTVCKQANDKIKQIMEEAAAEQKKLDFVEKLSDTTDQRVAEDLKRLKAAVTDTASKLTASERAQLATMINKPYKPTGNNRVPFKVETEYTALIKQLSFESLAQQERERKQQHTKKKGQSR